MKTEPLAITKQGKHVYLNDVKTRDLMKAFNGFFESYVDVPRMRVGKQQTFGTFISEETLVIGKFLRHELNIWTPIIVME